MGVVSKPDLKQEVAWMTTGASNGVEWQLVPSLKFKCVHSECPQGEGENLPSTLQ
jgi:hypothetical protein